MPGGRIDIEVAPDFSAFPSKFSSGLRGQAGLASTLGRGLGLAIVGGTALAAVGLKEVITLGNEYTANLNELQAVTGATGLTMAKVGTLAKELGSDLSLPGTSAADAAAAMKELAKGGLSVDQAMTAAKGTLQLAAAAQIEAAQAAEIQSDALNQFGLAASQAGHVADVLANTANAASGEVTDIANALKYVGPVAKAVGADIDSVATAIGLIATQGIRGEQAGTSLRGMIASLSAPSGPAREALKALSISAFDATGKFVGLRAITEQLTAAKRRMTEAEFTAAAATAFGNEGMTVASALASTGAKAFDDMAKSVTRAGGAADVAAAKTKGLGGAWEGFVSQAETSGIEVYEAIDGPLEGLVRSATGHMESLGAGVVRGLETAIAAGQVYGPRLAEAIRSRAAVIRDAATDVLAPLAGGGLAIGNEGVNVALRAWDQFTDVLDDVVDGARPAAEGIRDLALSAVDGDGAVSALAAGVGLLGDGLAAATDVLGPVGDLVGGLASAAASLPGPLQAAVLGLVAYRVASSALGNSNVLPGMRQFSGEMRVQASLAAANGLSLSRMESALAAYRTTQIPAIVATRRFTDTMADLRAEAASAGRPMGLISAAMGTMVERTPALAAMRDTYRSTFETISTGSERAALSAGIATESLGRNMVIAANRAAIEVGSAGQRIGQFGPAVARSFDAAREAVSSRASSILSAVKAIPTGMDVAAINAAASMRRMASSVGDAVSSLPGRLALIPTAIGVGVINTLDRVPGAVTGAVDALGRLGAVAGGTVAAGVRGLASAASGLVGALGGPWGLAIAAAGVGLSLLAGKQADAAAKAKQHASAVDGLAAALRESNGAISEQVRLSVAQRFLGDEFKEAASAAKTLNVSMGDVTDAALNQGDALDVLRKRLQDIIAANMVVSEGDLMGGAGTATEMNDTAQAAQKLLSALNSLAGDTDAAAQKNRDLQIAISNSSASMVEGTSSGRGFAAAVKTLGDNTASADDRARALRDALDALSGGSVNLEAANARLNEQMSRLSEVFGANVDKTQGWGAALLNADGSINTVTQNGRRLFDGLQDISGTTAEVAQKTYDLAISQGDTMTVALGKATAAVQTTREAFIAQAGQMGLTAQQATDLANRYGLIPEDVSTLIQTPGMSDTQRELVVLRALIDKVPPDKPITVRSLSDEAKAKLIDLGYTVTTTPNNVTITANSASARQELNNFLATPATKVVNLQYRGALPGLGQPNLVNHDGNYVMPFARGGMAGLTPMASGIATVVPPNTWRVVGDRMDVPEAYIPINKSWRSQQILARTASEMGYDLIRRFAIGGIATTGATSPQQPMTLDGLAITGRLRLDADGMATLIDARVQSGIKQVAREVQLRGRP